MSQEIITQDELKTIKLDVPIKRGETTIAEINIVKPDSGALRGLSLVDIGRLEVDALQKLIPRISRPNITMNEVKELDSADLMAIGVEAASFLMRKSNRADFQNA